MGPAAELGPLDVQLQHHDREDFTVSGLDVASSLQSLAFAAIALAINGGAQLVEYTGLQRKEVLNLTLQFMAQFFQPAVSKIDPYLQHQAVNQLKIAERYASRMLNARNLPAGKALAKERADALLWKLVNNYPAHGFVISRDEARELGLPVNDAETHERWASIKQFYSEYTQQGESLIQVVNDLELIPVLPVEPLKEEANGEAFLHEQTNPEAGEEISRGSTLAAAKVQ